jgi:hypothetical protein
MSEAASIIMKELLKQCIYLDSIADLIRWTYPYHTGFQCYNVLMKIGNSKIYFNRLNQDHNFSHAIRNLRNAWYHESAFIQDNSARSNKMKFTAWKVIQFYYGIYCAISSMVRCENVEEMGHEKMINYFTSNILRRKELQEFFPSPFCFVLSQNQQIKPKFEEKIDWSHGLKVKSPSVEGCLKEVYQRGTVSIFHYFHHLRNWVNYEDTYIFRRFYATSIKPIMYSNMSLILSTLIAIAEVFLMNATDYEMINKEAWLYIEDFQKHMESNIQDSESVTLTLRNRFNYYENAKNWFK